MDTTFPPPHAARLRIRTSSRHYFLFWGGGASADAASVMREWSTRAMKPRIMAFATISAGGSEGETAWPSEGETVGLSAGEAVGVSVSETVGGPQWSCWRPLGWKPLGWATGLRSHAHKGTSLRSILCPGSFFSNLRISVSASSEQPRFHTASVRRSRL